MAGLVDKDEAGHDDEGEECFDLDGGLCVGKRGDAVDEGSPADVDLSAAEGCVHELEEVQGVWVG